MEIDLFDTDFSFEFIHLNEDAIKFVDGYNNLIFCCAVTGVELIKACPNKTVLQRLLTKHFAQFSFIPIEKGNF